MPIACPVPTDNTKSVDSFAPSVRGRNTLPRRVSSFVQHPHAVSISARRHPSGTGPSLLTLWLGLTLLLFVALPLLLSSLGMQSHRAVVAPPVERALLTNQPQKPSHPDGLFQTPTTVAVKVYHQASVPAQSVEAIDRSNRFIVRFGTHWGREVVDLRQGPTQDWVRYRNRRQPQTPETREPIPHLADALRLLSKHHLRDGALLAGWLPLLARGDRFKHPDDDDPPDERTRAYRKPIVSTRCMAGRLLIELDVTRV